MALGACRTSEIVPPPAPDAGVEAVLELIGLGGAIPGSTTYGTLAAVGGGTVTSLAVEVPAGLAITLEADTVAPGRPVLVRADLRADAVAPIGPYGGPAPFSFRITGVLAGANVALQSEFSLFEDAALPRSLRLHVHPPKLDVSTGAPAIARLIVEPMSSATLGKVTLRSIPGVQFATPTVEITGLTPVLVEMTVSPELRAEPGTRVQIDAYMGRALASSGSFELVATPPDPWTPPPVRVSWVVPLDLYLRPGTSVPVDLAGPEPALKQTTWEILDLPEGVTAAAAEGVVTFTASPAARGGAHFIRLVGTRAGFTETNRTRLFVGRVDGDWPLLGDSPTVKDAWGSGSPGHASVSIDAAGAVRVICPIDHVAMQDLRLFKDGAWSMEVKLPSCDTPTLEAGNGMLCYAARDWDARALQTGCWSGPTATTFSWQTIPMPQPIYTLGGGVLAFAQQGETRFHRWVNGAWRGVAHALTAQPLDIASQGAAGFVTAAQVMTDKWTPAGWTVVHALEVHRFDGTAWSTLDELGADRSFVLDTPTSPDARRTVALETAADGSPVVAWLDAADERLHVSRWSGSAWQPQAEPLAPSEGFFIYELSMKVDPAGAPVIAWREADYPSTEYWGGRESRANHLRVHRLGAEGWQELGSGPVNFDPSGSISGLSLALDAAGRPHVSWQEGEWVFVARHGG